MPIPGLTDIYQFSDWAQKRGIKKGETVTITGELGGTVTVSLQEALYPVPHYDCRTNDQHMIDEIKRTWLEGLNR